MIAVSGKWRGSETQAIVPAGNIFKNAISTFTRSTICKTLAGVAALGLLADSAKAQTPTTPEQPAKVAQTTKITNQDAINAVNNLGKSKGIAFGAARDRFIEAYFAAQNINLHEITKPGAAIRGAEFNPASKHEPISTNQKKFWGNLAAFEKAYSIKPVAVTALVSEKAASQSLTSQSTATTTVAAKAEVTNGSALNSLMRAAPKGKNAYDFADAFLAAQGRNIHDILNDRKGNFSDFLAANPKTEFKPHQKGITADSFKKKWGISLEDAAKQAGIDMSANKKTAQTTEPMALEPTPTIRPATPVTTTQGAMSQPSVATTQQAPVAAPTTQTTTPAPAAVAPDFSKMKCVDVLKHLMQEAKSKGIKNPGKQFEYAEAYLAQNYNKLSVYRLSENPNRQFEPEILRTIKPRRTLSDVQQSSARTHTPAQGVQRDQRVASQSSNATLPVGSHIKLVTESSRGMFMKRTVTSVVMPDGQAIPLAKDSSFRFFPKFRPENSIQRTRDRAISLLPLYLN